MEYRNWNNKPLRTSLLGYGCMRFPTRADGSIDEPRAEALLNTAKAAGVNYFDTAYPYHNGQSEPFVGRVIAKWERSSFYLATKMPLWTCKSLADAQRIFEEQLQRLGVEYIDFYLLHSLHKSRYEQAKELGIVDWLWQQKAAGRIRNFGFSCHDNAAGFEAILRDQPWDFCQLQYNYLDRDDRAEEISGDRGYQLTEECILTRLSGAQNPVSASALAAELGVSRQIVVGDVALLRAGGAQIDATPRGYQLHPAEKGYTGILACVHRTEDEMRRELYTIVDQGGVAVDVAVENSLYGEIRANLNLASRYDVDTFLVQARSAPESLLSRMTGGVHLHTLRCPDRASFERIRAELDRQGLLYRRE